MQLYPFFIVGVCTLFPVDRGWLMATHCTNHRLKLDMKDAFLADAAFEEVDKVLLEMYLITRDSGKVKRLLKSIAMRLDVIMWHLLNLMEHAFKTTNIEQSKL